MKLKKKKKDPRYTPLPPDSEVYKNKVKIGDKTFKLHVHPKSRVPYIIENGVEKTIDPTLNNDENELRYPDKKNPILYGGRLKLYWLCDQGLKRDNNSLRWEQTPQMQKKKTEDEIQKLEENAQ